MLKFCKHFLLNNVRKRVLRVFFFILFRIWVICQNKIKTLVSKQFTAIKFINNSRSKQNKKNPEHAFKYTGKQETRVKLQQKILNSVVAGARKRFQFFRQIVWFLGNNRALPKFNPLMHNVPKWSNTLKNHDAFATRVK